MKDSPIQWCDTTVNPSMGCDGCELRLQSGQVQNQICQQISQLLPSVAGRGIKEVVRSRTAELEASEILKDRVAITHDIFVALGEDPASEAAQKLADSIKQPFKCYAGILTSRYGGHSKGYPVRFEDVTLFPGRMAKAVSFSDLRGKPRADKPWLDNLPRLNFLSDMGDMLSTNVSFEYLRTEVIDNVLSPQGRLQIYLWLTKRPERMVQFATYLADLGIPWPDNIVAMTTVTSDKTLFRIDRLREVPAKFRGLSIEPLWTPINPDLTGIDLAIVGGESGGSAQPFHLEWAYQLRDLCASKGVAYFIKQLGKNPRLGGEKIKLKDGHGGDWAEWPLDLRVRQMPAGFRSLAS